MRVLDAALRVIRWLLIWICIPTLIVIVFLSAAWVEHHEKKSREQEKRLSEIELKLNDLEWKVFRMADDVEKYDNRIKAAKKEVTVLADTILDVCVTDTPRPLKKQKGRKQ